MAIRRLSLKAPPPAALDSPPPLEAIPLAKKKMTPRKKQLASKVKKATPTKKIKKIDG